MNMENYLVAFYPGSQTVHELYYSLAAVSAELKESGNKLKKQQNS